MGVDLLFLAIFVISWLRGFQQGFIRQLVKVVSWIVALVAAFTWHQELALFLSNLISIPALEQPFFSTDLEKPLFRGAAFFILLIGVRLLTGWLGSFLGLAGRLPVISQLNRFSGALLSLAKSVLILMLVVNLFSLIPSIEVYLSESWFADRLLFLTSWLLDFAE